MGLADRGGGCRKGEHTHNVESSLPTLQPQPPSTLSSATAGKHPQAQESKLLPLALGYSTARNPCLKGPHCSGGPGDRR
ncbi:hypothetical protein E2C01_038655 [Portunus trituberculatus]|uniref:Uncharacterized protein n=1 Tax=Portunus trituberculatus TaxID=210409 RepID=A0A5B7FIK9_PORTR|nr:hypothetical protein [Portunus trituberculatus]